MAKIFSVFFMAMFSFLSIAKAEDSSLKINDFSLKWFNAAQPDTNYNTAEHPDTTFVLEMFFNSCTACRANAPMVNNLAAHYAGNPKVQVLALSIDCQDAYYRAWVSSFNPNHPILNDCRRAVLNNLGTTLTPTTYVVDCKMNVRSHHVGTWTTATYDSLKREIDAVNAEGCSRN